MTKNTVKKLVFGIVFSLILYLFFDVFLFPIYFYCSLEHGVVVLVIFSVVLRVIISSFYYSLIINKEINIKMLMTALAINGLPLQFTESLLLDNVDVILTAKAGGLLNEFMLQVTSYCIVCIVLVALIFELPRLLIGSYIIGRVVLH